MNFIDQIFRKIAMYVAENLLTEEQEAKIIRMEELWRSKGQIVPKQLLWLQRTLDRMERKEKEETFWREEQGNER